MRRPVVVWVDDPRVDELTVRHLWPGDPYEGIIGPRIRHVIQEDKALVPPDDQLTRDIREAVRIVESSGWSHRHKLAARIRAAFQLDEEEA